MKMNSESVAEGAKIRKIVNIRKALENYLPDLTKSKEARKGVTETFIMSNIQALLTLEGYTAEDITEVLKDPTKVDLHIKSISHKISTTHNNGDIKLYKAKQLASYMLTNNVGAMQLTNAMSIAAGVSINETPTPLADIDVKQMRDIEHLVAFMAFKESYSNLEASGTVMVDNILNDPTAFEDFLKEVQHLAEASKIDFSGNPYGRQDGYIHTESQAQEDIVLVDKSLKERYLKLGYVEIDGEVDYAPFIAMFTTDNGAQRRVSGTMSITMDKARGTSLTFEGKGLQAMLVQQSEDSLNQLNDTGYPRPIFDSKGIVSSYTIELPKSVINKYKSNDYDFISALGMQAHTLSSRGLALDINENMVDNLKGYYDEHPYLSESYINVGTNSPNKEGLAMWRALPQETKEHITATWGSKGMEVSSNIFDSVFGYGIGFWGAPIEKLVDSEEVGGSNLLNKAVKTYSNTIAMALFGNNAVKAVAVTQRTLYSFMQLVKNIVVIRTLTTVLGNTVFNQSMHIAHGILPHTTIKYTKEAITLARRYEQDRLHIDHLKAQLELAPNNVNIQGQLKAAEQSVLRNPITSLIKEYGILSNITQDITLGANSTYDPKWLNSAKKGYDKLPSGIKAPLDFIAVNPNTTVYKVLEGLTGYSDFTSKYVFYKHYMNNKAFIKKHGNKAKEEAMKIAQDLFINYDIPLPKRIEELDRAGLMAFSKYYLRVLRGMGYLFKNRPISGFYGSALYSPESAMEIVMKGIVPFTNPINLLTGLGIVNIDNALGF
jgi:hypothetical protein